LPEKGSRSGQNDPPGGENTSGNTSAVKRFTGFSAFSFSETEKGRLQNAVYPVIITPELTGNPE
jgi:hypothetical protein